MDEYLPQKDYVHVESYEFQVIRIVMHPIHIAR